MYDDFMDTFMSEENAESNAVHKSLLDTISKIQETMSDLSVTDKDSDDDEDVDLSNTLVIQAFGVMCHF